MIKIEKNDKMAKAIERVKEVKPMVRYLGGRDFTVTGRKGDTYNVKFAVNGKLRLAQCDCKAGQSGMLCYHVAAAAGVNVAIQTAKRDAAKVAPTPVVTPAKPKHTAPILMKPQPSGGLRINGFDL